MASVDVSVTSDLSPESAWELASDLKRFDEWLTIFGGWKSEVPAEIEVDTQVSSLIRVKGFRNVIHWRVTRYDEPKEIELVGNGRGGVCISLSMQVEPRGEDGSSFGVVADLSGGLLSTPVGHVVARVIKGDVDRSVRNLASLR
ncbi:type II toxin-antitoxin system Rv0910 family toxin [Mycolicibacterium parafortuitum]|uniref:Polyketide cyclase/dehydrase [Tsukamurella paurometabola DSM] n=1 Tax=Mycolicibacterium parafortuitum TaxID=39692 RepID=A0A375YLI3_MYCPF|nr:SRPBCC family protein [Mycolicibacterium parafortuitum]ORB30312.1 polyketide cyclase / dehydrase and lipid transport [Mycolicibacterium parafortuitum]SRX82017.1 polyketide cyclase/dehydrase [Tsukamurella paurometabola DSM] [Mycolicibacterium parafortuitum]